MNYSLALWKQTGVQFNLVKKESFAFKRQLVAALTASMRLGSVTRQNRHYMVIVRDER